MAYYDSDTVYQTQTQALNDRYTVDGLKALAKLVCDDIPTRKADLVAAITGATGGKKIKGVFNRLDRIGQLMDFDHFYGGQDLEYLSRYDGLKYFRLNPLGAYVLGLNDGHDPPAFEPQPVLTVLPNHEVVITDAVSLSPADKLFLDKIAKKASSALWRLTLPTLLAAAQSGTDTKQVRAFLEARSSQPLPQTVIQLLNEKDFIMALADLGYIVPQFGNQI